MTQLGERAPQRLVHAKGGGAFGFLEITEDISQFTRAALFQPGARTQALVRFSTVAGELGSPDTWRDPRGFALRFYTAEGNYDLVGNNSPVFFLRDPAKFPDLVRSQGRRPDNGRRDHDRQWDFWTRTPESAHQVTWLMGDRGIPRNWRQQNGYGTHTFRWTNAAGERFWIKYHLRTDQGIGYLTAAEAAQIAGEDADYHIADLWNSISTGNQPSWTLSVQVMRYEDAADYRFNPFDVTKVWPHRDYPLIPVGRLVLNRNPENYFAQIEQAAFEPANLVPGIGPSPDPMLLGRLAAYPDTLRHRIGPNYRDLPVNRAQATGEPAAAEDGLTEEIIRAARARHREDDDFGQAGTLVREVLDEAQRQRLVDNVAGHLRNGVSAPVLARALAYWREVDAGVGESLGRKFAF